VSIEEAEAKARELNVMFIETSAKAGFNIKVTGVVVSSLHNFFWSSWRTVTTKSCYIHFISNLV